MNSFYVPALAGQIYAMPGMETKLHGVFDKTGEYEGFSANYSGWGFSNMRFAVKSLPAGEFDKWVAATKASAEGDLSRNAYLDRKSTRLKLQSLMRISYAVFCLKKKKTQIRNTNQEKR